MTYFRLFLMSLCITLASVAFAADNAQPIGNADNGKALSVSATCVLCHGADGKAIASTYPNLAGQGNDYLYRSLVAFKKSNNPVMQALVVNLSEQDMADLAAYYSSQPATHEQADPALVARGERIFRGGIEEAKVPACAACHGPKGEGNGPAGFPALAGQNPDYLIAQLQAFREGQRTGGINDMMHGVTAGMSTDDMKAVASYISGLH